MKLVVPSFYKDFECIAGVCPDSCCQGWEVDADPDSLKYYGTLGGSIRDKIDSVLDTDEFGNTIFRLAEKKRCPFLNSNNLCDMHIAIGAEHTPFTCRMFPRFINDFGSVREMGLSFSCPVAADIIYNLKEPMSFVEEQNDLPVQLNEIDADVYFYLVRARKEAFAMVCNRQIPLPARLLKLIDYGVILQAQLDEYSEGGESIKFTEVFKNPEVINPRWPLLISGPEYKPVADAPFNENIASYFIFRYFLDAVYDYDILSKIKTAVLGVLINTYFGESSWTMHLWSKETEHSQCNMDRFKRLLKKADCLTSESLKQMLLS